MENFNNPFENYITRFPFDGKEFYYDYFLKLNSKYNYTLFKKLVLWYQENKDKEAKFILLRNKQKIDENNYKAKAEFENAVKNRKYQMPTLENVTNYIGMFDEV